MKHRKHASVKLPDYLHSVVFISTVTAHFLPRLVVREGDEVTLPCGVGDEGCGSIDWMVSRSAARAVRLVQSGQILLDADRLSVAAHCSLVIKTVRAEDGGFYTCRAYTSSYTRDAHVYLFVINSKYLHRDIFLAGSC